MIPGVRKAVASASPYTPGKTVEEVRRELGLERIIKLGSNENPWGPFPAARTAMVDEISRLNMYPDVSFRELKELIAGQFGLKPDWVALSHGAEGMLQTLGKVFLDPEDEVVLSRGTYGLYREISLVMGAVLREFALLDNYSVDIAGMEKSITEKTKLIWLNNPNNPTGLILPPKRIEEFIRNLPEGTWTVLDEAYGEFALKGSLPDTGTLLEEGRNLVVVRTFSKAWGLAGARIGYALARPELVRVIDTVSEPFNANRMAIAGACASLREDGEAFRSALKFIVSERGRVSDVLRGMGLKILGSSTNFIFFTLPVEAEEVSRKLLKRGIIVRPCGGWGFSRSIRVSIGTSEENTLFLETLAEILSEEKGENV